MKSTENNVMALLLAFPLKKQPLGLKKLAKPSTYKFCGTGISHHLNMHKCESAMNANWGTFWKDTALSLDDKMIDHAMIKNRLRESLCEYIDEEKVELLFSDMMSILLAEGEELSRRASQYYSFAKILERGIEIVKNKEDVDE